MSRKRIRPLLVAALVSLNLRPASINGKGDTVTQLAIRREEPVLDNGADASIGG